MSDTSWHVTVSVQRTDGGYIANALGKPATKALVAAAGSDTALSGLTATARIVPSLFGQEAQPDVLAVEMTVAASYPVLAVSKAWAVMNDALNPDGGWDLKRCSISMRPVVAEPQA